MSDGYNGWTNYETWNVALWWGENGMSGYWIGEAEEMLEADDSDDVAMQLADRMKSETINEMPEVTGMYADLLKAALDGSTGGRSRSITSRTPSLSEPPKPH